MNKKSILKLNSNWCPIDSSDWQSVMTAVVSGAMCPVDIHYEELEDGTIDPEKISWFSVVRDFKEWLSLPIRDCDDYVQTPKQQIRIPPIVICERYNKIFYKKLLFPTKENILKRDNYCCQYTGESLSGDDISIDHIKPVSRGGENSWENMVACNRKLNIWKSDRTPEECGLKLLRQPYKPNHVNTSNVMRSEWAMFVKGGQYDVC